MSRSHPSALARTFVRTLWIFQALAAAPIVFFLSVGSYTQFLMTFETAYDLVISLSITLMASAIIFIVLVQRKIPEDNTTMHLTLRFEIAKATLATLMWMWFMLDVAVNPLNDFRYWDREVRIKAAAYTAIVLFILFYPTVWHASRECKCAVLSNGYSALDDPDEHTPLVRRPWPPEA